MITLSNQKIKMQVALHGAELKSLVVDGKEYMWQADPAFWGRTSPVLFPFVGKLKDDKFQVDDIVYPMSQHGFARDRDFKLILHDDRNLIFSYLSTEDDFKLYPYKFELIIKYTLSENKLGINYEVINRGKNDMYYQIGAHPAFNIEGVDDVILEFPNQKVVKHYFDEGLQTKVEDSELSIVDLSYDLINDNLPCYSRFEDSQMTLIYQGKEYLKFKFDTMEQIAIWSPEHKNAKFVCVEPWKGICSFDSQVDYQLSNKDAMSIVSAGQKNKCGFEIEVC